MESNERMTAPIRVHPIIERARGEGRAGLTGLEAAELLRQAGIAVIATRLATTGAAAAAAGRELGFPVALKIASPDIVHKSDAGGVRLGLVNGGEVEAAYREVMAAAAQRCLGARLSGVYVQPMAPAGTEVIIGMKKDAQFGPVLMFGLGGVWVELLQDVSLRVTPISRRDAAGMVREIRGYPLLVGYRGCPPVDTARLENMLLAVARLAQENPSIKEIDLNPVIARGDGAVAVDARVVLEAFSPCHSEGA
jgi:acetate---CoA ligase (ADP-forming) subunit beta